MSAVEAYSVAKLCIDVFNKIRTDDDFDLFWELAKTTQNSLEVKDPALPRACKRPRHYEDGAAEPYHPPDVKQHYKQIYFQSVDSAITTIENRFQQSRSQLICSGQAKKLD